VDVCKYWDAVLGQDAQAIRLHFAEDAVIRWHNTNECFTVPEFIRANCEYPGHWCGEVEHVVENGDTVITVTRVYDREKTVSFHAVTFLALREGRISSVDEYWGDDVQPPRWRQDLQLGRPIRKE